MANVLKREKQMLAMRLLVEGNSIRATERITGVHRDTIMKHLVRFGKGCEELLDRSLRRLAPMHVEIDEQWTWVGKKQARLNDREFSEGVMGDQYLFLALDQDSKLIISHLIGKRNEATTRAFIDDLAGRIVLPESVNIPYEAKPQISTDGWSSYPAAIQDAFGSFVQYGQIIKNYANPESGRYAPPEISKCDRRRVQFIYDLATICTSHIERFNCTTRQFVKRFCRLTLAFSKKLENLEAAVAMHIANYNFCWRPRENGKSGRKRPTPVMAAGVVNRLWSFEDLFEAVQISY
jgi:IS1 family transposase